MTILIKNYDLKQLKEKLSLGRTFVGKKGFLPTHWVTCDISVPDYFADHDDAMDSANSNMAAGSSSSSSNSDTSQQVDRIALLYPKVDESETPLPRSWSPKDKFTFIGLSQNNLKVHYKGKRACALSPLLSSRAQKTVKVMPSQQRSFALFGYFIIAFYYPS